MDFKTALINTNQTQCSRSIPTKSCKPNPLSLLSILLYKKLFHAKNTDIFLTFSSEYKILIFFLHLLLNSLAYGKCPKILYTKVSDKMAYQTFTNIICSFCICDTNINFKHISLLWSAKGVIMGHVGDTAFLPMQKTHITRLRG